MDVELVLLFITYDVWNKSTRKEEIKVVAELKLKSKVKKRIMLSDGKSIIKPRWLFYPTSCSIRYTYIKALWWWSLLTPFYVYAYQNERYGRTHYIRVFGLYVYAIKLLFCYLDRRQKKITVITMVIYWKIMYWI